MKSYRRRESVSWTELDGEFVFLELNTGEYSGLQDPVSKMLWLQLEEPRSEKHLLSVVIEAYDVDREAAAQDLHAFLHQLLDAKLIEEV